MTRYKPPKRHEYIMKTFETEYSPRGSVKFCTNCDAMLEDGEPVMATLVLIEMTIRGETKKWSEWRFTHLGC